VKVALSGTLPQLQQEIARAERGGPLDKARLRQLARAVAEREIAGASGADGAESKDRSAPQIAEDVKVKKVDTGLLQDIQNAAKK